ncbi:MAG TPA: hypothetical protein VGH98_15430 [Gemmatimonadaceae bacterium]|jgi:hypothetical protein
MALREFVDARGRRWTVWDVFPTLAERRVQNAGPPPGLRERRRYVESRTRVSTRMANGWLAFEAQDGERRRLAPVPETPEGWATVSEDCLRAWCETAEAAPPVRRLIE